MLKAYKYRIYPNNEQKIQIAKTFGCCRFVYNQTLAYRKEVYEKEKKSVSKTDCNNYCNRQLKKEYIKKKLNKWLEAKFIPCYGEWFYGKVFPRIIIEQYLEDGHGTDLYDYKVFCFNGKAKLVDVHCGRFGTHKRNIYDLNWKLQDVKFKYDNFEGVEKPKIFDELIEKAELLASNFHHARVDFFIVNDQLYFGEITFTNGAGFDRIKPYSFDKQMGEWLKLK